VVEQELKTVVNSNDEEKVTLPELIEAISDYMEVVHGGTLSLVGFDGETVQVQFGGVCTDCELRRWDLVMGVERAVKRMFPEVKKVVAV
jgi:Fe-S cluster biogenesis protein NfuA